MPKHGEINLHCKNTIIMITIIIIWLKVKAMISS